MFQDSLSPGQLSFHGCSRLLIWIIGAASLTALTIKDFIPLLEDYKSNNVAIQVQIAVGDDSFVPPRLSLCIPFYKTENIENEELLEIVHFLMNSTRECAVCQRMEKVGWNVWNDQDLHTNANDSIQNLYRALSLEYVKKVFTIMESTNESIIDQDLVYFGSPISTAIMNFFIWIAEADYNFQPVNWPGEVAQSLMQVLDSLMNNSKIDNLYVYLYKSICRTMTFQDLTFENEFLPGVSSGKTCDDLLLDETVPVQFDATGGIWIATPPEDKPKRKEYKFIFSNSHNFWSPSKPNLLKSISIYPDISVVFAANMDKVYSSYIYKTMSRESGLNISIRYSVQMSGKDTRSTQTPCNKEISVNCFTKCTKMWVIEKCSCVPFTLKEGLPYDHSLPFCTSAIYGICNISSFDEATPQCMTECKNSCEFTVYNWQISHDFYEVDSQLNVSQVNVALTPMITTYSEFSWTIKNTPEQFVSQMGGIVNFYLGFSGLSIFATMVAFIDFLQRYMTRKRQKSGETARTDEKLKNIVQKREMFSYMTQSELVNLLKAEVEGLKSQVGLLTDQVSELKSELRAIKPKIGRRL